VIGRDGGEWREAATSSCMMNEPSAHVIWLSAAALATSRVFLLAHYLTDVLGGLTIGVSVDHIVRRLRRPSHAEVLTQSPDENRKSEPHGQCRR
jgi:membrane-associated phospholipid phosphatase